MPTSRNRICILILFCLAGALFDTNAQDAGNGKSLAEKLGYARDAKLVVDTRNATRRVKQNREKIVNC